jgi:hypothetical protein
MHSISMPQRHKQTLFCSIVILIAPVKGVILPAARVLLYRLVKGSKAIHGESAATALYQFKLLNNKADHSLAVLEVYVCVRAGRGQSAGLHTRKRTRMHTCACVLSASIM